MFETGQLAQGRRGQEAVGPGAEAIHSVETPPQLLLPWGWLDPPFQSGLQRETQTSMTLVSDALSSCSVSVTVSVYTAFEVILLLESP